MAADTPVKRLEEVLQLALALLLVGGCWLVLKPFVTAILFAVVIAISTWPQYAWTRARFGGRAVPASLLGCLAVTLLIVGPVALLFSAMADGVTWLVETLRHQFAAGPPEPPAWLARMPWIGDDLQLYWRRLVARSSELPQLILRYSEPLRHLALNAGRILGSGILQILLSIFLLFFVYRDGERLSQWLNSAAQRITGDRATGLLATAQNTVVGVMVGVLGTALVQAMVALTGFAIAGVPAPFLLAALTFVGSMVLVGPPLVWGGATIWLFNQGEPGWGVFMALYGLVGISGIDHIIKPLLISRSSRLPFALTLMGAVGGVLAFGFMGVFVGPILLALAVRIGGYWLALGQLAQPAAPAPGVPPPHA